MLVNASGLFGRNVMSLQVGEAVAQVVDIVLDPNDLSIIAFVVDGPEIGGEIGNILDVKSIREFSTLGFIIDSTDEFVEREDVVRIREVMGLNFNLAGLKVETKQGTKLGKVFDYTVDTGGLKVQQLIVKRPTLKSLIDPELMIGRTQIVEVDDYKVVVKDEEAKIREKATGEEFIPNFVNPFRKSPEPQASSAAETESD